LRAHKKYIFLLFILGIISFSVTFFTHQYFQNLTKQTVVLGAKSKSTQPVQKALPQRITIPTIGVIAAIQLVGLTPEGAMEVPSSIRDVGWYKYGSQPGEPGSAVIAGHYDGKNGTKGVFEKLHLLKRGDKIYIEDSALKMKIFIVRESRRYNPEADSSAVFNQSNGSHLNLITCEGSWDDAQKSYSKRLVVFADAMP
jgi:sortase A